MGINDVVVLGSGPIGNYVSTLLARRYPAAKIKVVDCTQNLGFLHDRTEVYSNIQYSISASRPSLFLANENRWGGALMKWPRLNLYDYGLSSDSDTLLHLETSFDFLIDDLQIPHILFQPRTITVNNAAILNAVIYPYRELANLYSFENITFLSGLTANSIKQISGQVITIELASAVGDIVEMKTRNLIVCLGSLETCRLLFQSKEIIQQSNHLGTRLTDHLNFSLGFFYAKNHKFDMKHLLAQTSKDLFSIWPRLFVDIKEGPDFFLHFRKISQSKPWTNALPKRTARFLPFGDDLIEVMVFVEVLRNDNRRIYEISSGKGGSVGIDFYISPEELDTYNSLKIRAYKFLNQELGVRLLKNSFEQELSLNDLEDTRHPAGTTPISSSIADGVVDNFGQLHGTKNILIFGNSLLYRSSATHPTMTSLAHARFSLDKIDLLL